MLNQVLEPLLDEAEGGFGLDPLRDVAIGPNDAVDVRLVEHVGDRSFDDAPGPVAVPDSILNGLFPRARDELLCDSSLDSFDVVGMYQVSGLGTDQLFGGVAEHTLNRRGRIGDRAVNVSDGDHVGRVLHHGAEALLAPPQLLLDTDTLADI